MKALLQTGSSGRVPVPPEKRFLINLTGDIAMRKTRIFCLAVGGFLMYAILSSSYPARPSATDGGPVDPRGTDGKIAGSDGPFPGVRVVRISKTADGVEVLFEPSLPERYYTLRRRDDLRSGDWRNVLGQVGVEGVGGTQPLYDDSVAGRAFYAIRETPQPPDEPGASRTVEVVTDPDLGGHQQFTAAGGSLAVTESHGNRITLTVPENAIHGTELIMLTPIATITGAPFGGGLLAGVEIQPNGLQLFEPATLAIRPHDPDVIAQLLAPDAEHKLTGFSYVGDGVNFHFYPYHIADGEVRFAVPHFSGYGGGKATDPDRRTQREEYPPSEAHQKAAQEAAAIFDELAENMMSDPDYEEPPEHQDALMEILRRWYEASVLPMARAAQTDADILDCAIIEWLTWKAYGQLWVDDDVFKQENSQIRELIALGYRNAAETAHQRAVTNMDASQISRLLDLWAHSQLLGYDEGLTIGVDWEDRLQRMMRFELDFDSLIRNDNVSLFGAMEIGVRIERMAIERDPESLSLSGRERIYHVSGWVEHMYLFEGTDSVAGIDWAFIPLPSYESGHTCQGRRLPTRPKDSEANPADIRCFFLTGEPLETFGASWTGSGGGWDYLWKNAPHWRTWFEELHAERRSPELGSFLIDGWDLTMGEPYARRRFSQLRDGMNEVSVFSLWYAPLP